MLNIDRPVVLNVKHMTPEDTGINVMRPSRYSNPFIIGRDGDRDRVCDLFEEYVYNTPGMIESIQRDLKGHNLICCCKQRRKLVRCHADTLLRIAND